MVDVDSGPVFRQKFLPFTLQQQFARARIYEHAQAAPRFHQAVIHQLLITLEDREWIDAIFGRDCAHRWQRIALFEHAVENHRDDAVAKLAVNRLTVIPLTVHQGYQLFL